MKQYYITSKNFIQSSDTDCYLSPDDPVHDLKIASQLNGLGSAEKLAQYNNSRLPKIKTNNKRQIEKELNIKPGTPAWFKLYFGKDNEN